MCRMLVRCEDSRKLCKMQHKCVVHVLDIYRCTMSKFGKDVHRNKLKICLIKGAYPFVEPFVRGLASVQAWWFLRGCSKSMLFDYSFAVWNDLGWFWEAWIISEWSRNRPENCATCSQNGSNIIPKPCHHGLKWSQKYPKLIPWLSPSCPQRPNMVSKRSQHGSGIIPKLLETCPILVTRMSLTRSKIMIHTSELDAWAFAA